jgi:hypothetical protein
MVSYSPNTTVEQVQDVLAKKAKELEIPLTPEQIHVQISGADITISAHYSCNVHTPIKHFVLTFEPTTKNHRI